MKLVLLFVCFVCQVFSQTKEINYSGQVWMAENLNVVTFRNGDPIPHARTKKEWQNAEKNKQPAWCYYNNNPLHKFKYGKLYNWYAVIDNRGLAPKGWHIPTNNDWEILIYNLGDEYESGIKLKSVKGWNSVDGVRQCSMCKNWTSEQKAAKKCKTCKSNGMIETKTSGNGTNEIGFNGYPCGLRMPDGSFDLFGMNAFWWTYPTAEKMNSSFRGLYDYDIGIGLHEDHHGVGLNVRCLKD